MPLVIAIGIVVLLVVLRFGWLLLEPIIVTTGQQIGFAAGWLWRVVLAIWLFVFGWPLGYLERVPFVHVAAYLLSFWLLWQAWQHARPMYLPDGPKREVKFAKDFKDAGKEMARRPSYIRRVFTGRWS